MCARSRSPALHQCRTNRQALLSHDKGRARRGAPRSRAEWSAACVHEAAVALPLRARHRSTHLKWMSPNSSTSRAHCVPLPEPGPPSTNTTLWVLEAGAAPPLGGDATCGTEAVGSGGNVEAQAGGLQEALVVASTSLADTAWQQRRAMRRLQQRQPPRRRLHRRQDPPCRLPQQWRCSQRWEAQPPSSVLLLQSPGRACPKGTAARSGAPVRAGWRTTAAGGGAPDAATPKVPSAPPCAFE